jgi:hypothetical protein
MNSCSQLALMYVPLKETNTFIINVKFFDRMISYIRAHINAFYDYDVAVYEMDKMNYCINREERITRQPFPIDISFNRYVA